MNQRSEQLRANVEASFLFTKEEKEALAVLCDLPEFSDIIFECLAASLHTEKETAGALVPEISKESVKLAKEIETRETLAERREISIESVFI